MQPLGKSWRLPNTITSKNLYFFYLIVLTKYSWFNFGSSNDDIVRVSRLLDVYTTADLTEDLVGTFFFAFFRAAGMAPIGLVLQLSSFWYNLLWDWIVTLGRLAFFFGRVDLKQKMHSVCSQCSSVTFSEVRLCIDKCIQLDNAIFRSR